MITLAQNPQYLCSGKVESWKMPDAEKYILAFVLLVWWAHFRSGEEISKPLPHVNLFLIPYITLMLVTTQLPSAVMGSVKCNDEIYDVQVMGERVLGMLSLILFLIETRNCQETYWKCPSVWACREVGVCVRHTEMCQREVERNQQETKTDELSWNTGGENRTCPSLAGLLYVGFKCREENISTMHTQSQRPWAQLISGESTSKSKPTCSVVCIAAALLCSRGTISQKNIFSFYHTTLWINNYATKKTKPYIKLTIKHPERDTLYILSTVWQIDK